MHWKTMLQMGGRVLECMVAIPRIGVIWDLHTRRRDSWVTQDVTARCHDIGGNHVQRMPADHRTMLACTAGPHVLILSLAT